MKKILSVLLALAALWAFPAQAQTTLRVHVVFDESAALTITFVRHMTLTDWVNAEVINRTNQIFTTSGASVSLQLAGITSGPATNAPKDPNDKWDDSAWIRNSIPIQSARDANNASVTLYVSSFKATTQPYSTRSGCGGAGGSPQDAVAGVALDAQAGGRDMVAVALATALCIDPFGYTYKAGTNTSNCEVAVTVEATNEQYPGGVPITTQNACWKTSTSTGCYPNGPAAIRGVPSNNPSLQNCTYSNGQVIAGVWNETVTCGTYSMNWAASVQGTYPNTFYCQNITRLYQFSNPSLRYNGLAMGDATHNNAAVIANQAIQAAGYKNTKIAPKLKAAALSAASAAQN